MTARIRPLTSTDAAELAAAYARNREFLAPYEPVRAEDFFTEGGQRERIRGMLITQSEGRSAPFVIVDDTDRIIGTITVNNVIPGAFQSCSVGYWIDEASGGRGYAGDALRAVLHHAFRDLGLHRVEAATLEGNRRSQAVLTRAGFERIGLAHGYLKIAGRFQDHVLFQRLAT